MFCFYHSSAQEMWGISNSNFSGNMGLFLNPSTIVNAPYQYEINLLAADLFIENTFIYFPADERIVPRGITGSAREGKLYKTHGSGSQNGFGHVLVIGPSYIRNKTQFAWGLHTAFRTEVSVTGLTTELGLLFYDTFHSQQLFGKRFTTNAFNSAYASWIELGGTIGKVLRESETKFLKGAITADILLGVNGFYFDASGLDFTSVDSSSLNIHNMNATLAHSMPGRGESFLGIRGLGLGTTYGITYINHRNRNAFDCNMTNDKFKKYNYRLGFSLMDLGLINYFSKSQVINITTASDRIWNGIDTLKFGSFQTLDTNLIKNIGGTISDQSFSLWLPFAVSVQFDYQVQPNIFANLSIVNRIKFAKNQIARANQLNLSGRYERRNYEFCLNATLSEYKQPSVGVGFRYKFFVIGTDRLLQIAGLTDVEAFDFFFGFKFQFCKKPFSKGPDCPAYN